MNKALPIIILALTLAGCASDYAFREGERLLAEGSTEAGLRQLEMAVRESPNNAQYRTAYIQAREAYLMRLIVEADAHLLAGRAMEAEATYRKVLDFHVENLRARAGLEAIETQRRNQALIEDAKKALARGETETARSRLRAVLAREPEQPEALRLTREADEKSGKLQGAEFPKLAEAFRRPVSLQFRDAPIRTIFDALSRQSGLNFVFDKDVRTDVRLTIFVTSTPIVDSLDMLLKTGQLAKKVLNDNTLLIYPALPAKLKDYQDLVVKGFFLSNAEVKQTVNLVRTMTKTRDIHIDERLNLLVVRDTPEAVRLVEKLLAMADRPEPEVMLEVEILEVKRGRLQELGVQYPTQFGVPNITKAPLLAPNAQGVQVPTGETIDTLSTLPLNVRKLRDLVWGDVTVSPSPTVNLRKDSGDVNILANPRIRVKNKEKAKIHIGDKVPVITANVTSTGVTSESVSYLDVGIKVDVEPQVHLEGDVAIRVGLEVSNIVQPIKSATGTLTYQLGSRNASTVLRLKDGETQVLAGLISDEDRASASKVPLLGDIPLLGRLFSTHRDELSKTEIVLLITPRIIRNIDRPELADSEFFGGTESAASDQSLVLRPLPAAAGGGRRAPLVPMPGLPVVPTVQPVPAASPPPAVMEQGATIEAPVEEPPPGASAHMPTVPETPPEEDATP